jgi:hypothetical protein
LSCPSFRLFVLCVCVCVCVSVLGKKALVRENISSVPVVDASGRVVDIYSRQDAM